CLYKPKQIYCQVFLYDIFPFLSSVRYHIKAKSFRIYFALRLSFLYVQFPDLHFAFYQALSLDICFSSLSESYGYRTVLSGLSLDMFFALCLSFIKKRGFLPAFFISPISGLKLTFIKFLIKAVLSHQRIMSTLLYDVT